VKLSFSADIDCLCNIKMNASNAILHCLKWPNRLGYEYKMVALAWGTFCNVLVLRLGGRASIGLCLYLSNLISDCLHELLCIMPFCTPQPVDFSRQTTCYPNVVECTIQRKSVFYT